MLYTSTHSKSRIRTYSYLEVLEKIASIPLAYPTSPVRITKSQTVLLPREVPRAFTKILREVFPLIPAVNLPRLEVATLDAHLTTRGVFQGILKGQYGRMKRFLTNPEVSSSSMYARAILKFPRSIVRDHHRSAPKVSGFDQAEAITELAAIMLLTLAPAPPEGFSLVPLLTQVDKILWGNPAFMGCELTAHVWAPPSPVPAMKKGLPCLIGAITIDGDRIGASVCFSGKAVLVDSSLTPEK